MPRTNSNQKPPVVWLEGVLDYFNATFPHGNRDPRELGFGVGRQIIGLYLIELLLKYALDDAKQPYDRIRNFQDLFRALPKQSRCDVEEKYRQLLRDGVSETWDFAGSVESFFEYLGDDPFNDSRYFWERGHPDGMSIVFLANGLRLLIYALFIPLHGYPEGEPLKKRYDTKFISFEDSLENQEDSSEPNKERADKRITPSVYWLEGLLVYFNVPFPHKPEDPRSLGFQVGQRIIGLYLTEMLLKYAADDLDRQFGSNHNLLSLFKKLPRPRRRAVANRYKKVLSNRVSSTWDYAQSLEHLLDHLGDDPITETRYFWEGPEQRPIHLSPGPLMPLIYALFLELHGYPQNGPTRGRYQTTFLPFGEYLKNSTNEHVP